MANRELSRELDLLIDKLRMILGELEAALTHATMLKETTLPLVTGALTSNVAPSRPLIRVNEAARRAFINNEEIQLTTMEFNLLNLLVKNAGRAITFSRIEEHVWGYEYETDRPQIRHLVLRLRRKLRPFGVQYLIQAIRSIGYRFESGF